MRFGFLFFILGLTILICPASAITWADAGGCWTATDGSDSLVMWNATGSTTWQAPNGVTSLWYLVVSAGGSVGQRASAMSGGGGAGGLLNGTLAVSAGTSYPVVVGAYTNGTAKGQNSTFSTVSPWGGGFGSITDGGIGGTGGSGGGTAYGTPGGSGTAGQGNNGGTGSTANHYGGGGGGGCSATGGAGSATAGGTGGAGCAINITGTITTYATGGAGCTNDNRCGASGTAGHTNGAANTGDGAGADTNGYSGPYYGGSGIVIIRYTTPIVNAPTASFNLTLIDTSANDPTSWIWNATNLLGNNTPTTFSTAQNPVITLSAGNWFIELIATNSAGSTTANKTVGLGLSSPRVYFWERTA